MNQLSIEMRAKILHVLLEGNSMRSTSRILEVSYSSVVKVLERVGRHCEKLHEDCLASYSPRRVEADEIWAFVYCKKRNKTLDMHPLAGDAWTWMALDPDSKLIIAWYTGERDSEAAHVFMKKVAKKIKTRTQLTTDSFSAYSEAVESSFGWNIDYAQVKKYPDSDDTTNKGRRKRNGMRAEKKVISGNPNPTFMSTSLVERQNLNLRMCNRRFTRRTNAFSKKFINHKYMVDISMVYHNYIRFHSTLSMTPAMQAGIQKRWWDFEDLIRMAYQD